MASCVWTTSATPPARRDSGRACSASARDSAPASPTAASTRRSARATSCCRSRTAATSRSSPRSITRPSTAHRSAARCAIARTTAAAGSRGSSRVDDIAPIEARLDRTAAAGHRRRPDGVDLRWSQIGVNDVADDAAAAVLRPVAHRPGRPPVGRRLAGAAHPARDRRRRVDASTTTSGRRLSSRSTASRSTGVSPDEGTGRRRRGVRHRQRLGPDRLIRVRACGAPSTDPTRISGKPTTMPSVKPLGQEQRRRTARRPPG